MSVRPKGQVLQQLAQIEARLAVVEEERQALMRLKDEMARYLDILQRSAKTTTLSNPNRVRAGLARAASMTPERRREIAQIGANARAAKRATEVTE